MDEIVFLLFLTDAASAQKAFNRKADRRHTENDAGCLSVLEGSCRQIFLWIERNKTRGLNKDG
jgi:hypothetical protein